MIKISSSFDSGNIVIHDCTIPSNIRLGLRPDAHCHHRQWFHFRLQGAAYQNCKLYIEGLDQSSYPKAWDGYMAMASYDQHSWFRVPTQFNAHTHTLEIEHTPLAGSIYYAYFEPYSWNQHLELIGHAQSSGLCRVIDLGTTPDGHDFNVLVIGHEVSSNKKIWITARQHPGETMSEWWVEGFLNRLLDAQDATARSLLDKATFYIVPNMNPDGSIRGNLRTNAHGIDLNRSWQNTSEDLSPEVFWIKHMMEETGVDLYLDIHGDETIPYVFLVGTEGVKQADNRIEQLEKKFLETSILTNPDVQKQYGYAQVRPGEANLDMATNYVAHRFACLSFILEMPFKDNANLPDDDYGWNGQRSLRLGESMLSSIWSVVDDLR
jgi:murein tripeptide amidase MpaA